MLQKGYMQVRLLHESSLSSSVVLCALYTRQRNSLAFAQPCTTTTCYIHTCLYTRSHASEFFASINPQPSHLGLETLCLAAVPSRHFAALSVLSTTKDMTFMAAGSTSIR